jgi:hypothetical protein
MDTMLCLQLIGGLYLVLLTCGLAAILIDLIP